MILNTAGQTIGAQMISATDGSAFTGTVTVYITGDAGTQAIGSVGSGICTHEGNGYHTYRPSQDETAYSLIAFTFTGTGAIPRTIQVVTVTTAQQSALIATGSTVSTVTVTANTVIFTALRLLGVLSAGNSPAPADVEDSFTALNTLVDSWGTQRPLIYTTARDEYTWTAADSSATLGASGADFTAQRPVRIDNARWIPDGLTIELTMNVYSQREYADVVDKTITSAIPSDLYIENTHPLLILRPYPIPSVAGTLVLYTPTALTQFATKTTSYTLPNGYARMLNYNLAMEIAPLFDVPLARLNLIAANAVTSMADVKRQNSDPPVLSTEWRPYNIYTDS